MRGNAHAQVMAPDGRHLYTLYTRDATPTEPAKSFVHVLDLEQQLASCVDLPPTFAISPLGALAVSPSGNRLYVSAPVDRRDRRARHQRPDGHPHRGGSSRIRGHDGPRHRLEHDAVRRRRPGRRARCPSMISRSGGRGSHPGTVIGLKPSTDGSVLYVSLADRVLVARPAHADATYGARRRHDRTDRPRGTGAPADSRCGLREVRVLTGPAPARTPGVGSRPMDFALSDRTVELRERLAGLHPPSASIRPKRSTPNRWRRRATRTSTHRSWRS